MTRLLIAALTILLLTSPAFAGTNDNAKIAGHLVLHSAKGDPCDSPPLPACNPGEQHLVVTGQLSTAYDLYIYVLDADSTLGVSGAQLGINYQSTGLGNGLNIYAWNSCADFDFASDLWPASNTTNRLVFERKNNCQRLVAPTDTDGGVTVLLGSMYVYAYGDDKFEIVEADYPGTDSDGLRISDCGLPSEVRLPYPENAGIVSFGSELGRDPCQGISGPILPEFPSTMQLTYVRMNTTEATFYSTVRQLRRETTAHYLLALAPNGVICLASDNQLLEFSELELPALQAVTQTEVTTPADLADSTWNHILTEGVYLAGTEKMGPAPGEHPLGSCTSFCRPSGDQKDSEGTAIEYDCSDGFDDIGCWPWLFSPEGQTSKYLMNDVGVQMIFPESVQEGACVDNKENWTPAEIRAFYAEACRAYAWLASRTPAADLTFWIVPTMVRSTTYEPIREMESNYHEWLEEIYEGLGYGCTWPAFWEVQHCGFEFNNDQRGAYDFDWFFTSFVIRNRCQGSDYSIQGTGATGLASYFGPYHVCTWAGFDGTVQDRARTVAHETLHVFGAADEYTGSDEDCDDARGYLRVPTRNHEDCGDTALPCMMLDDTFTLCEWTRGQIGWWDRDGDGVLDPLDWPNHSVIAVIGDPNYDPVLEPGDVLDIYDMSPSFVWRQMITEKNQDIGMTRWDFINHHGQLVQPSTLYAVVVNGHEEGHIPIVYQDSENPVVFYSGVESIAGPGDLRFELQFYDGSAMSVVRARVYPEAMPLATSCYLVRDALRVKTCDESGNPIKSHITKDFMLSEPGSYEYEVLLSDRAGKKNTWVFGQFFRASESQVGVPDDGGRVGSRVKLAAHPNPFSTRVEWVLEDVKSSHLFFEVFDVSGRLVRSWTGVSPPQGSVTIAWDGRSDSGSQVPNGVYFLRISDGNEQILVSRAVLGR